MKIKKRFQISLKKTALGLFVCGLLILTACAPQIEEFTPERGREGTEITITGRHFKNSPAENTVKIGEVTIPTSDIILASKTKIIVKIRSRVMTGLISVRTSRGIGYSKKNFLVARPVAKSGLSKIVEDELNKLANGQILFNPPQEMKVGVKERVEVRIAKTITEDLTVGLRGRGEPYIEEIRVGTFMKVLLRGDNFNINTLSHEEQLVAGEGFTNWDWDVTPLNSGIQSLLLTVTVRVRIRDIEEKIDYPVFEREINVHVNMSYALKKFIKNYWWGITTAIIVPILLLIIKIWWDSKKKIRRKTKKGK